MPGWTEEGLGQAWRALSQPQEEEQWRIVHLAQAGRVTLEAGRHYPDSREALVVSFPELISIDPLRLPQGKGFDVVEVVSHTEAQSRTSLALVRKAEGSLDIFATIVVDVIRSLSVLPEPGNSSVLDALLDRVREWQAFMSKAHRPLSSDGQIGLMGELCMLQSLIASPLDLAALDCWQGPMRAAQDFHIGAGAVEVKSTVQASSFLARINSIEQLDSDRFPSFLAAFRFEESPDGTSLVEMVNHLRSLFAVGGARRGFDALLMVMGYLDEHATLYERPLSTRQVRIFAIDDKVPRLTRAALPSAIRSAVYTLDLDAIEASSLDLPELLNAFGLIK